MNSKKVLKRDGSVEEFNISKIKNAIQKALCEIGKTDKVETYILPLYFDTLEDKILKLPENPINIETIQDLVEDFLMKRYPVVAKPYILYRHKHNVTRDFVNRKIDFINNYKSSHNTADATIDDNSNVAGKNIGILNNEIHKSDNIEVNRGMIVRKLRELFPDFDAKQYLMDLNHHVIYKHDESSFAGISPYCCSISMYPFLTGGLKQIGGLSAMPKNLDSFCGMYINLIFAVSAQFAGAVATSELFVYFDYFARKDWGDEYYLKPDAVISTDYCNRRKTIQDQIHQYFQQIVYSINQPAAARGLQSAFVNFSYFDKPFFDGMFGHFYFPDNTQPKWESVKWLQKEFMQWFNWERLKCILTFPVESVTLLYKDGEFQDKEMFDFVCEEYERGHSFFTYISDSVDSLSSCCFSKDQKVLWKSSTSGVHLTTLEELHNTKWEPEKKNLRIYHNGSWVRGKSIKLSNRKMYKVVTENNKEFIMTDNHINVTLNGEKQTCKLSTDDYLMFNTMALNATNENDEHLTYEQGFVVGAFLGDGSFGSEVKGTICDTNFSLNAEKYDKMVDIINIANKQVGGENCACLNGTYNNVYPVRISSKNLAAFIMKWTNWKRGTYCYNKELNLNCLLQSVEFRKGILEGWYSTDGGNSNRCYTTSSKLAECMEVLITSLGMQSVIDISDRTDEPCTVRGIDFNRNYPLCCIRWYEPANHRNNKDSKKSWIKKNNSIYFKIKSIEECEYNDDVYCIECTNQDEPYFTLPSGLITHNCRLKNKLQTKEFNFTNGNMGVETGSKSVITLNLNRITQDAMSKFKPLKAESPFELIKNEIISILERVYKYHTAYNELLWDLYDANLLPVYKAGFIDLNKQYLTIGINGLNQAAEYLGIECSDNDNYKAFCQMVFSTIKEQNLLHKVDKGKHKLMFNTECVPAESLAAKNYNWDKEDGYKVPEDTNLYASYIFKPNDDISILEKIRLHGKDYIGDYLDGGSAAHLNLDHHLSKEQYRKLLEYSAKNGCQYLTFNIPNCECDDCGYIAKQSFTECPLCGSKNVSLYDRIIGYLTKVKNWAKPRRIEQTSRVYENVEI